MVKSDLSKIKQAFYIKLGEGGRWERLCFQDGTIRVGFYEVPAALVQSRNTEAIRQIYLDQGAGTGTATRYAGELQKFYAAGPETLWITFSGGKLYWAIATGTPEYLGADKVDFPQGSALRRTVSGWQSATLSGAPLHTKDLSGCLTKVAGYRGTICTLETWEFDYLVRRLQDQEPKEVTQAKEARRQILGTCEALIKLLRADFELLVDLVFTQSGWRRIGSLGGTQKTADIELIQPMTGERAIVQVKSTTSAKEFAEYEEAFAGMAANRYFYVWHTCKGKLTPTLPNLTMIGPETLAEHVLNAGLFDWLVQKIA